MSDDSEPRLVRRRLVEPAVLDPMGVEELRAYIDALRGEIDRAEAIIALKAGHRGAAEAVFGRR